MKRTSLQIGASLLIGVALGSVFTLLDGGVSRARLAASTAPEDPEGFQEPAEDQAEAFSRPTGYGAVLFQPNRPIRVLISREDKKPFTDIATARSRAIFKPKIGRQVTWRASEISYGITGDRYIQMVILAPLNDVRAADADQEKENDEVDEIAGGTGELIVTIVDAGKEIEYIVPGDVVDFDPCACP